MDSLGIMNPLEASQHVHALACYILCLADVYEETETDHERRLLYQLLEKVQQQMTEFIKVLPHMENIIRMYTSVRDLSWRTENPKLRHNPYQDEFRSPIMQSVRDILKAAQSADS